MEPASDGRPYPPEKWEKADLISTPQCGPPRWAG
jgi:hypothetical protein